MPAQYLSDHEILISPGRGQLPDGWETADAVVWSETPVDREMIGRMRNLRFMQRIGWFRAKGDATAALERGIPVSAMPQATADRVAQSAFTLMHMLARRIRFTLEAMREGKNPGEVATEDT